MYAFVQNVNLGANRHTLPQNGLQSVCNTTSVQRKSSETSKRSKNEAVQMVIWGTDRAVNKDITLDILTYHPTPVISGIEDKDQICYSVWKQVFGNAYVMESERAEAYKYESKFRSGDITLREFIRGVALSNTYRRRFFDCCSPYRAVELNFKHLLGRGPNSQKELSKHVQILANEGFEAEINSYIDSLEYDEAFGDDYVPYMRFKGTYPTNEEFNRMCSLYSSPGTTDKNLTQRASFLGLDNPNHVLSLDGAGISPRLVGAIATNSSPSFVSIKKGIPSRPDLDIGASTPPPVINSKAKPVQRVEIVPGSYMYLTEEEAKEMGSEALESEKIVSLAEAEIQEAQAQIKALEEKIAELSLIK